ncbi:hypothetical protein ACFOG5_02600 [Pedobacter fastidiosus]|uniref:hypothetical protein n=1 Tax=Pedobacter fastidiosus TaxID=2765361 RepID=UPI00360C7C78
MQGFVSMLDFHQRMTKNRNTIIQICNQSCTHALKIMDNLLLVEGHEGKDDHQSK